MILASAHQRMEDGQKMEPEYLIKLSKKEWDMLFCGSTTTLKRPVQSAKLNGLLIVKFEPFLEEKP